MLVRLGEEGERARAGHLVEDSSPRAAASEVLQSGEIVAVGVQRRVGAGKRVVRHDGGAGSGRRRARRLWW